jgi:L-ascorbate metabolism protein UlaG (beta-lactamase superfamily)
MITKNEILKSVKMILMVIATMVVALVVVTWVFMQQPQFGKAPEGARLARMLQSPNYRNGAFQNRNHTPDLAEGVSYYKVIKDFIFGKSKRAAPATVLPGEKTDLKNLNPDEDIIVWFGHSSYFMQIGGKRILVDPVFSGNASPLSFTTRSFNGADIYTVDDMPAIDFLFISHDHYDHLDYKTIKELQPKVKLVITGLGVGAHLEYWGYDTAQVKEMDWNEQLDLGNGFEVNTVSARHFSGRVFKRNGTLWTSFVFTTPFGRLFLGGDSGYDTHFAEIGEKFGPFDLVILENGQYNESWKYIHMMPEQVVQAAIDLKADKLFPVHWSKFTLSLHDWDEPINRVLKESYKRNMPVMHPRIGQAVNLADTLSHDRWWDGHK